MKNRAGRLLAAATVLAVLGAQAAPAEAKAGGFKVLLKTGLRGEDSLTKILLPSRRSGFAFGERARGGWTEPLVYRISQGKWRRAKLPKGVTGTFGQADGTSARNVWATLPRNGRLLRPLLPDGGGPGDCPDERRQAARGQDPRTYPAGTSKVLRWNGERWTVAGAFKNAYVEAITTLSPKDVWAYGADKAGFASWHYDGRSWKRAATPFYIAKADAVARNRIWGMALTSVMDAAVARYDGTRWQDVTPAAELPNSPVPTKTTKGFRSMVLDVSVVGATPWVQALTVEGLLCGKDDGYAQPLLRWTGKGWRDEATTRTSAWIPTGPTTSDGKGGIIYPVFGADGDAEWDYDVAFVRRAKSGRVTVNLLPAAFTDESDFALAAQPATGRLFAVGARAGDGVVWRR